MDKSATRRSPTGAQVVGHGREVLALVELGPVTLEALPDGVFDVAGQGGGGLAVALQEQHGRPGLVGDAPPNLHHLATAWARREPGGETGSRAASRRELRLGVPQSPVVVIDGRREKLDRKQLSSRWARQANGEAACSRVKAATPYRSEVPPKRTRVGRLEGKNQFIVADGSLDGCFAVGGTIVEQESVDGQPLHGLGPGHRES